MINGNKVKQLKLKFKWQFDAKKIIELEKIETCVEVRISNIDK